MADKEKQSDLDGVTAAAAGAASPAATAQVGVTPVTDPTTLDQARLFAEAVRQTRPMTEGHTPEAGQAAGLLKDITARARGLLKETAQAQVTRSSDLTGLTNGANPAGKIKEVVAVSDYRDLQAGRDTGMVHPPEHIAPNVKDVRISPDSACKRDVLFRVTTKKGLLLTVPGGQVKTGGGQYIADSLVEMSKKPGYGRTGYVDSRFVNADGSPRVAANAFAEEQARRLRDAKIRLRGIRDLDQRGDLLLRNLQEHGKDGLDPAARRQLQQLRDDIAQAYGARGVAGRIAGGAAVAAATAAVVSLAVQYATTGKIDVASLRDASGKAALLGGVGAAADAGIYHAATQAGMAPEAAKAFAQQSVAAGFCLLAVGADAFSEIKAARDGDATVADAVVGTAFKSALDILPLVTAPLGLAAIPVLLTAQLGGRWVLAKAREADRRLELAKAEDQGTVDDMDLRISAVISMSDESDEIFARVMGTTIDASTPHLRVVK